MTKNRMSRKSWMIFIIVLKIAVAGILSAQENPAENFIPDTTQILPADSMNIPPVIYEKYQSEDSLDVRPFMPYRVDNTIYTTRFVNSVGDALRTLPGFDLVREGGYGQRSYIVFGGLPVDRYVLGDYVFDYGQFHLPVNGITDCRLISLAESDVIFYPVFSDPDCFHSPISFPPEYIDTGALSSAYLERGDFGFSHTMVKFVSTAGNRVRVGLDAGIKLSNGNADNQKKHIENYRMYGAYQLSENYQLQPDFSFFFTDDRQHFLNYYSNYRGGAKSTFIGFSLALAAKDKSRLFSRSAFIFQRYTESVRGNHPRYRQESLDYRFKVDNGLTISNWKTNVSVEPFYKNIQFEPKTDNYVGLDAKGISTYDLLRNIELNITAALTLSKYANKDISIAGGAKYTPYRSLSLSGQLFRITRPPADFELFASSPEIGLLTPEDDSIYYSFHGSNGLQNTDYTGYTIGMEWNQSGMSWRLFLKQAEINDLTFWSQNTESSAPYQRNANWLMGSADLRTVLPFDINAYLSYSYGRVRDADSHANLSIVPRHKAFASFAREVIIPKLGLDVNMALEGEYHSENYSSPYNPANLGDYMLMNIKLQFKIKSLTIYYNENNLFNKPYRTIYDYEIRREVWWGFLWNFIN